MSEMTDAERPYILRSSPMVGEVHSAVRVDESGNFAVMTQGKPKALAALLRMLADEIDTDEAWGGDPNAGLPYEDAE